MFPIRGPLPEHRVLGNDPSVELVPVAMASVLVAIAGQLGITLGWWLGRRGERERQQRNRAFTRLARQDLRVGAADPWEDLEPIVGERIAFRPRADG